MSTMAAKRRTCPSKTPGRNRSSTAFDVALRNRIRTSCVFMRAPCHCIPPNAKKGRESLRGPPKKTVSRLVRPMGRLASTHRSAGPTGERPDGPNWSECSTERAGRAARALRRRHPQTCRALRRGASGCARRRRSRPSRNPSGAERFDAVSTFPRSRRARMRPSPRIGSQPAWGPKQSPEPHLCYIRRSITRSRRRSRSERAQPRRRLAQTQQPRQRHSCAQVSHSPRQPQR